MIQKIEKLVSIGKFRNYIATGMVAFNKLTLFYADNGSGKTTITSVCRSLTMNDPEIIRRRISTPPATPILPQAAQIIQRTSSGNSYHTFGRNGWSNPFPNIEIFDAHFINDNIYSGFEFNDDQRKQLHQFVIGAAGIGVRAQIERNKIDKTASRQTQEGYIQQLIQLVGNGLTTALIDGFMILGPSDNVNIDQRILVASAALASANANSVIQSLPRLSLLAPISSEINFVNLISDLQTTTLTLLDDALKTLFKNHCTELQANRVAASVSWLKTGFNYLESKKENGQDGDILQCPFCKQTLDESSDILKAYTLNFNEEFNNLVQKLQAHLRILERFNLDTIIHGLNTTNQSNTERINSWKLHLPASVQHPTYNIISDVNILKQELQSLINIVNNKLHNPSASASITEAGILNTSLQAINKNIATYNLAATTYNTNIVTFLSAIQTTIQAQEEVNKLNRIKKRFEPAIAAICLNISTERVSLRGLEMTYTQLIAQQQTSATTFFTTYKDRINYYLGNVFRTPFQIASVNHVPPQGRATQSKIDYRLTMNGSSISFDPAHLTSAKDCLSEGDKSMRWPNFYGQKNLLNLEINYGSEKVKREPTPV